MNILDSFSLKGKIALVTGASYGIGFDIATAYAQAGATIVFNDIRQELVDKGLAAYKEEGIDAHGYVCDVTDEAAVQSLVKRIEEEVGIIDILVNNAGIAHYGQIQDTSYAEWNRLFSVNAGGAFLCTRAAALKFLKSGGGSIVNISSVWGETGASCEAAYSASKAALIGFTKAAAKELAPAGIRVNCVSAGMIATDMNARFSAKERRGFVSEIPAMREGTPEEVAAAVLFLAESRYLTGEVLRVNGGALV